MEETAEDAESVEKAVDGTESVAKTVEDAESVEEAVRRRKHRRCQEYFTINLLILSNPYPS